jgi:molybdopterin converting factor small subunit
MSVVVQIPTPLREQAGGNADVSVPAGSVKQVLDALVAAHPPLGPKLFDGGGLRPYVNVFVGDEDIRYLDELDTPVADGQTVALIPAVAGG